VALIHFTFNVIGTALFTVIIWIFHQPVINLLTSVFPGSDTMSMQMRVSVFHVIFNVTTTLLLLPFVKQLVAFSKAVIRDKAVAAPAHALRFVDDHLLAMPSVAMAQVKQEIHYMLSLAEENTKLSFNAMQTGSTEDAAKIEENEAIIDFTNGALTSFLIKLSSAQVNASDEAAIGAYFHVLNDLERIGDHAQNFFEITQEMQQKELVYSQVAQGEIQTMRDTVLGDISSILDISTNDNAGFSLEKQSKIFNARSIDLTLLSCTAIVSPPFSSHQFHFVTVFYYKMKIIAIFLLNSAPQLCCVI
jgi:phosphate:Na+ symporter